MNAALKGSFLLCAGLTLAALVPPAWGQTLCDPSFELATNPLPGLQQVLGPPTFGAGFWGVEVASVVPSGDGITPRTGDQMLQMWDDGLTVTQAFQAVDVGALAECIDAGLVSVTFRAHYNAPGLPAEIGGTDLHFFACDACWGSDLAPSILTWFSLDGDPSTWEEISSSGTVPAGTRWLVLEVGYQNTTLTGRAGYVDDAELIIDCPTPAAPSTWGRVKALYR